MVQKASSRIGNKFASLISLKEEDLADVDKETNSMDVMTHY